MPKTSTHDTGGTRSGTIACLDAIRKVIDSRGECTETEARGIAMSLYPPQVLIRIGAQKLKNRKRGTSCRFADEINTYMNGGAVGPDAVQWFKIVGGNRQLTRLKCHVRAGLEDDLSYDDASKRFLPANFSRALPAVIPETSFEAFAKARAFTGDHHRKILDALGVGPAGASGIADRCGMLAHQINKRLAELARAGKIVQTGRTVQSASGRGEREWRVAT